MDLNAELERLYRESPIEVQRQFDRLQENRVKAREIADMVGNIAVDEIVNNSKLTVSVEILEFVAKFLLEDCKNIRENAADMLREAEVLRYERSEKERSS